MLGLLIIILAGLAIQTNICFGEGDGGGSTGLVRFQKAVMDLYWHSRNSQVG